MFAKKKTDSYTGKTSPLVVTATTPGNALLTFILNNKQDANFLKENIVVMDIFTDAVVTQFCYALNKLTQT